MLWRCLCLWVWGWWWPAAPARCVCGVKCWSSDPCEGAEMQQDPLLYSKTSVTTSVQIGSSVSVHTCFFSPCQRMFSEVDLRREIIWTPKLVKHFYSWIKNNETNSSKLPNLICVPVTQALLGAVVDMFTYFVCLWIYIHYSEAIPPHILAAK